MTVDLAKGSELWFAHLRGEAGSLTGEPTAAQWEGLLARATAHQLRSLTYRLLLDGPFGKRVPPALLERLRPVYFDSAVRNALLFRQTRDLITALAALEIPVMLLKGVHLARFVYDEPALRNMADVDLMVPRARLAEAERCLVGLGFGPLPRLDLEEFCSWSNHLAKMIKPGAPEIELHYHIERPTAPFRIDLDGLWERSQPAILEGAAVRLLSPEDLLLHLALHCSFHHEFDRSALKGLIDVDRVIRRHRDGIRWGTLVERANQWGASPFVYTTFRVAERILATRVPAVVLGGLRHAAGDEEIVETALSYTLSPTTDLPHPLVRLAETGSLRERARILWRNVILPRATMEQNHGLRRGSPLVYFYYLVRLIDLALRRGRQLISALRRSRDVQPALDWAGRRHRIRAWVENRPSDPATPSAPPAAVNQP